MTLRKIITELYTGPGVLGHAPSRASVVLRQLEDYVVRVDNENGRLLLDIPCIQGGRLEIYSQMLKIGEEAIFRYLEGEDENDIKYIRDVLTKAGMQQYAPQKPSQPS